MRHRLAAADRIMEENPDSALRLMNSIDTLSAFSGDDVRALYYLLLTQAQYKCYRPTTSDSLLDFSLRYYLSSGDDEKTVRTYYYRAMTLYERHRYDEAIPLLKRGMVLAEKLGDDELISKYYESIMSINYEVGDYNLMLKYAKLFVAYSLQMKNMNYIARGYMELGIAYHKLEQNDSSDIYYKKIESLLDCIEERADIFANLGCMYLRHGNLKVAEQYLLRSLDLELHYNTVETLTEVYMLEGRTDEAARLRDEIMKTDNHDMKIKLMGFYADQLYDRHNVVEACDAYRWLYLYDDSLRKVENDNVIAELQLKYDKQQAEADRAIAVGRLYKMLFVFVVIVIGSFAVVYLLVRLSRRRMSRLRHTIVLADAKYADLLKKSSHDIASAEQQIHRLESDRDQNAHKIVDLEKKILSIREDVYMRLGRGKQFYDELHAGNLPLLSTKADRENLIEYFSIVEYKKFHNIHSAYDAMPTRLMIYVVLLEMGLGVDAVKTVLEISDSTIRANKSMLKKYQKQDISG